MYKQGQYAEAMACFDEALRLNPSYVEAWNNKGLVFYKQSHYVEAMASFDEAIKFNPSYVEACYNKSNALYKQGQYAEAIICYDEVIKLNPLYFFAWYNKGLAFYNQGQLAEAIICYDEAIKVNPLYVFAWNNKGLSLKKQGQYALAMTCYDEAIRLNGSDILAWYNKGDVLYNQGKHAQAMTCYDEAIRLNPTYADAWEGKSQIFDDQREHHKAQIHLEKAMQLNPDRAACYLARRAWFLCCIEDYSLAKECINKALSIKLNDVNIYDVRGCIFLLQNDISGAEKAFDKALGIAEESEISLQGKSLIAFYRKDVALARKYFAQAEALVAKVSSILAQAEFYYIRAKILAKWGVKEEAKAAYEKALKLVPEYRWAKQELEELEKDFKPNLLTKITLKPTEKAIISKEEASPEVQRSTSTSLCLKRLLEREVDDAGDKKHTNRNKSTVECGWKQAWLLIVKTKKK